MKVPRFSGDGPEVFGPQKRKVAPHTTKVII
jgi:hypothetical protein